MCGIIGLISSKDVQASDIILDGLKRLEYRGYDSAGIATINDRNLFKHRAIGKIEALEKRLNNDPLKGSIGIGHTRWATHGLPTEENAHPHSNGRIALVHNGIIENYKALKQSLIEKNIKFKSDTDSEVMLHLIADLVQNESLNLLNAVEKAVENLSGAYAVAVIDAEEPDQIIVVRKGTPLAIGHLEDGYMIASDAYALAPFTKKIMYLEDGDIGIVSKTGHKIIDSQGRQVDRPFRISKQGGGNIGKGEYAHFMLKEIHEQPMVVGDVIAGLVHVGRKLITLPENVRELGEKAMRFNIVACGTAYYTGCVAKFWLEQLTGRSVNVDVASEFRYRGSPLPADELSIFVSQSGETLDTLEAVKHVQAEGQKALGIINTLESSIERQADATLRSMAGAEISVASTKATTCQMAVQACMALYLGQYTEKLPEKDYKRMFDALLSVSDLMRTVLEKTERFAPIARVLSKAGDQSKGVFFLARGALYPIALEGALKLKEITYLHAEGYPAGEMKHGPIALIEEGVPVIGLNPGNDPLYEKTASNLQEMSARGAEVILITDKDGAKRAGKDVQHVITMPDCDPFMAPILYALPVQLLAYYTALARGTDVDQPRNLAKSVTVE